MKLLKVTREEDPGMLAYVAMGLFAGLRRSELCALEWSEVDLPAVEARRPKSNQRDALRARIIYWEPRRDRVTPRSLTTLRAMFTKEKTPKRKMRNLPRLWIIRPLSRDRGPVEKSSQGAWEASLVAGLGGATVGAFLGAKINKFLTSWKSRRCTPATKARQEK